MNPLDDPATLTFVAQLMGRAMAEKRERDYEEYFGRWATVEVLDDWGGSRPDDIVLGPDDYRIIDATLGLPEPPV